MHKKVYKLRPSDYWRIGEHESWFHAMASRGFHLDKMGLFFAKFIKGEPKEMRYRIEVSMSKRISQEQLALYKDSGWDYVTSFQYFHVFSSPISSGAPELHTDPAEQSFTLKELDSRLFLSMIIMVVSLMLMFGMVFSIWFLDGTPTYTLVEGSTFQLTILAVFLGYSGYSSLQASRSIRSLRKGMIEGKPIDHHAPWEKNYRLKSTLPFLVTVVVGLSAILPFIQLIKSDTQTLPEENMNLPIISLAELEGNPELVREPYMIDDVDWANRYTYQWSLFAPVQYEADENGIVPGKKWEDGSGDYSPSIRTKVYELSIPALAEPLISDLIKRYTFRNEVFNEMEHPAFDRLLVYEEEYSKTAVASKGKAVMFVQYHGDANINTVISHMGEKIGLISE